MVGQILRYLCCVEKSEKWVSCHFGRWQTLHGNDDGGSVQVQVQQLAAGPSIAVGESDGNNVHVGTYVSSAV